MLQNPQQLIRDFVADMLTHGGREVDVSAITCDLWKAPHKAIKLPPGKAAVYVFSLAGTSRAPAGPHRVIKVGKAGPNSNIRFQYQHYRAGSAMSTLAGAIENNPVLWGFIGFPGPGTDAGLWLRESTDRDNFYFSDLGVFGAFEVYAKARLGSVYEGSLSSGAQPALPADASAYRPPRR